MLVVLHQHALLYNSDMPLAPVLTGDMIPILLCTLPQPTLLATCLAGGKSTLLRATCIAAVMAQVRGMLLAALRYHMLMAMIRLKLQN